MRLLVWLCRLGKWSFVDVFVMLLFNAMLRIEKQLSTSMTLIVYATPQAGIYAFCAAASLALAQSEWMRGRHEELCSVEALTASGATVARGGIFNSGDSGRLRSGWRTATTRNRVRSRLLHERGSLYLRLLIPAVGFLSLLVGFYGTTLVHCEIQGSLSYLPGQNDFSYTGAEMMRSASGVSTCESSRGGRDHPWVREVLVWLLLIVVVGLPIISFIAVSLLWIIGAGVPCKPRYFKQVLLNSAHRLMQLVEVAANLACLDVFLVSLLVVSSEIGNVVRAVGATVQTSTMSMSLDLSLGSGAVCLIFAAILLLVLNISTHFEAPALRNTLALAAGRGNRNVYDEIDTEDSDEDTSFVI
ncbi:Hypothetical Protein FCC1311_087682 [Hondaea fermentalgiana]|uniref:Transmembrane protein n=1 Tax=Hondaea fermentalgiana TaxID=2315210 RepID=A0A2R5GX69_9STRA|nr:Hypothetical Protein FCC1311_087682 [Hondaea fermentalgiana]|eukprot:GBG32544.1 Hypothetical Protein FCC1311_087682 [Hondaea fermentalgiana]